MQGRGGGAVSVPALHSNDPSRHFSEAKNPVCDEIEGKEAAIF